MTKPNRAEQPRDRTQTELGDDAPVYAAEADLIEDASHGDEDGR